MTRSGGPGSISCHRASELCPRLGVQRSRIVVCSGGVSFFAHCERYVGKNAERKAQERQRNCEFIRGQGRIIRRLVAAVGVISFPMRSGFRIAAARSPNHKQRHANAGMERIEQEVLIVHVADIAIVSKQPI
jgi:hypothetical protein